jgi:hypothetical protein
MLYSTSLKEEVNIGLIQWQNYFFNNKLASLLEHHEDFQGSVSILSEL